MKFTSSVSCIYYNMLSSFYIGLNYLFPYYNEEILNLQYKTIEFINEDVIFCSNSRKRKRFNTFIENLINKNTELIEQIRKQEEEDNNIENYTKIYDDTNEDEVDSEDEDNADKED